MVIRLIDLLATKAPYEHDTNSIYCWCNPAIHCADCWEIKACIHGQLGSENRTEVIIHKQDN